MIDEIRCQRLVELVTDYLEGKLRPAERQRFEAHLAGCGPCTTYVEQMRLTIRSLGRLSSDDLAPETKRDLLQAFRDWKAD